MTKIKKQSEHSLDLFNFSMESFEDVTKSEFSKDFNQDSKLQDIKLQDQKFSDSNSLNSGLPDSGLVNSGFSNFGEDFSLNKKSSIRWNSSYPWGRRLPKERIKDLSVRLSKLDIQRRLLKDRYEEALNDILRQEQFLNSEMILASLCEQDRLRKNIKILGYDLLKKNIDIFHLLETDPLTEEILLSVEHLHNEHCSEDLPSLEDSPEFDIFVASPEQSSISEIGLIHEPVVSEKDFIDFLSDDFLSSKDNEIKTQAPETKTETKTFGSKKSKKISSTLRTKKDQQDE